MHVTISHTPTPATLNLTCLLASTTSANTLQYQLIHRHRTHNPSVARSSVKSSCGESPRSPWFRLFSGNQRQMCDKSGRKRNAVCPENVGFDGKSEHLTGVVLLTTDQKVGSSNPSGRATRLTFLKPSLNTRTGTPFWDSFSWIPPMSSHV